MHCLWKDGVFNGYPMWPSPQSLDERSFGLFQRDPEVLASVRPWGLPEQLDTSGRALDDPLDRHSAYFRTDPEKIYANQLHTRVKQRKGHNSLMHKQSSVAVSSEESFGRSETYEKMYNWWDVLWIGGWRTQQKELIAWTMCLKWETVE